MGFLTDKQTLDDLNITGKYKPSSLFSLFNQTQTRGGEHLLEQYFNQPLSDAGDINKRSELIQYFHNNPATFPFNKETFEKAEAYFTGSSHSIVSILQKRIFQLAVKDEQFEQLQTGMQAAIEVINTLKEFLQQHPRFDCPLHAIQANGFSPSKLAQYDRLLRKNNIEAILQFIYQIDVYIAVANTARARNFAYATALPKDQYTLQTTALCHPALKNAVANPLHLHQHQNVLFLTGANMAGKSTFMKSLGIALYLAHMGFPVAAKDMRFSVRDGLYTSINVPDNLQLGYSHFYAEVLRVKKVAEEVAKGNDLLVIFDELFKGTNVKDAFDATLAVTKEFAAYRNCLFVISTHIIEVGERLKQQCDNLQFAYLPTIMEGSTPRYPYTLSTGITNDRHGMLIIENERILDMI